MKNDKHTKEAENDLLAELIRGAGHREVPPQQHYDQVFAAARETLQTQRHRRQWRRTGLAIAASLVAAISAAVWLQVPPVSKGLPLAATERAIGVLEVRKAAGSWKVLQDKSFGLHAGSELRTAADAKAAILLSNGTSLRLAATTTVRFENDATVYLLSGKIYIDAGDDPESTIRLITPVGTVTDVGTQFEILYTANDYRLRVREGQVQLLMPDDREISGLVGDQLLISTDGLIQKSYIAADDPDWQWAEEVATTPLFDGQPLTVLLDWVARETGRKVRFENPILELKVKDTLLHGNIRNLSPLQTLEVMLVTTDLRYELLDDGTILIYAKNKS